MLALTACALQPPKAVPPPSPLVDGNDARLLIDGPAFKRAVFDAITRARDHVNLETYILEGGPVGAELAALLEGKRAEGIDIRVLYDSHGSSKTPQAYFERLRRAGVAVCEFNPLNPLKAGLTWRVNNRDHRKILVVDGRLAITGGMNISNVYASSSSGSGESRSREEGWRDTSVLVVGPIVARFQRLFLAAWREQDCPASAPAAAPPEYFPQPARRGDKTMRLLAADPAAGESEMYAALISAVGHARRRVWLTFAYFVPDARIAQTLCDAARRGVDVRLVLPGFSDSWAPFYAGRAHYSELLDAGVRIYEHRDALLHAKTAVIDGVWSSVGSTNLDWRSLVHNYEADLVVLDDAFGAAMEDQFRSDLAASVEVAPQVWRERGIAERIKELIAGSIERLL
jgi:cardiolipin synthase